MATERVLSNLNLISFKTEGGMQNHIDELQDGDLVFTPDSSLKGTLLDFKWADHLLNDMSWLRADTFSWQSGDVYVAAYNHLVADFEGAELKRYYAWVSDSGHIYYSDIENVTNGRVAYMYNNGKFTFDPYIYFNVSDGAVSVGVVNVTRDTSKDKDGIVNSNDDTFGDTTITYYRAEDGHKICLPDQEDKVLELYNATGVAWYYILDTENKQFKLPRTKFGFTGLRDEVGGYVEAGLPNITGSFSGGEFARPDFSISTSGAIYSNSVSSGYRPTGEAGKNASLEFDASRSSSIYGNSDTVQEPATQMYLYFYVGNFERDAVEQTAGLNAELFNQKMDNGTPLIRDIFSPDEWENESMEQILSAGAGSGDLVFTKNWQEYDYLWFSSVSDSSSTLDDSPHWLNVKWLLSQAKAGVTNLAVVRYSSGAYWYVNPQAWTETTMPEGSGNESLWINKVYGIKLKNITAKNVGLLNYKGLFETASALVATVPTAMGEWTIVSNDETQGGLQTKYFSTKDVSGNFVWAFGGVIDSSLVGADYVVESQLPTAENGYTWYRKYASGWVEQGGTLLGTDGYVTTVFPVEFTNDKYTLFCINHQNVATAWSNRFGFDKTTTGFTWVSNSNIPEDWQASGMSA